MRILKAMAALSAMTVVVVGPPWALLRFIGNPIPDEGFSWNAPLTDGAMIGLLAVMVWILWAQLMVCLVGEVIAVVSEDRVLLPSLGTFKVQQDLARRLVMVVIAGAVAAPIGGSTVATATEPSHPAVSSATSTAAAEPTSNKREPLENTTATASAKVEQREAPTETVTVVRLDSLWSIAERHLGDGERWTEIAALNDGRRMNDGRVFTATSPIHPGWELRLPAPNTDRSTEGPSAVTVEQGDTLWDLSVELLGNGARFPELFDASRDLEQPVPLQDPDKIYPGQRIAVPAEDSSAGAVAHPAPRAHRDSAAPAAGDEPAAVVSRPDIGADAQRATQSPATDPAPAVSASPDGDAASGSVVGPVGEAEDASQVPGWVLPAFAAGGGLLAGALLIGVRQRRAAAGRKRCPGRVPAPTPAAAVDVERSIAVAGATAADFIEQLDLILKRLSDAVRATATELPKLVAVEVTESSIGLHLRAPLEPPAPWISTDDGRVWVVDRTIAPVELEDLRGPEPWPLLVTVGTDANGATWLLNLEGVVLSVSGDRDRGRDFVRYLAAEIACNPWSLWTDLDLVGVGAEMATIAPSRIHHHQDAAAVAGAARAAAIKTIDWLNQTGDADVPAGRCRDTEADAWPSRMLILGASDGEAEVDALAGLVSTQEARTATALVVTSEEGRGLHLVIDEQGRLVAPAVGLVLNAVGMTQREAEAAALLLTHLDAAADVAPADMESPEPWAAYATATGTLRDEHIADRHVTTIEEASTLLPKADQTYVAAAATTAEDLAVLAPMVLQRVAEQVQAADPTLDTDLEQWRAHECERPRLSVLGAPTVRATGTVESRLAFHTSLLTYLWSRPQGATREEVAAAMGLKDGSQSGKHVGVLRSWLGDAHVPDARQSPAGKARGVGAYQVLDVLVDFDLFRRLRARAQARGEHGIADLETALSLVRGEPLSGTEPKHWSWALDGSRIDHEAVVAIVDVAHTVVTARLADGDTVAARAAVAVALKAAPYEEIARLDLAAVLTAEGREQQAAQLIRDEVVLRVDDGDVPDDLPARSSEILQGQDERKRAV